VLLQEEEEQRGDVSTVEAVWRSNIFQTFSKEPWPALASLSIREHRARTRIIAAEGGAIADAFITHLEHLSTEHFWRVSAAIVGRATARGQFDEEPSYGSALDLIAHAMVRQESLHRADVLNGEATSRKQIERGNDLLLASAMVTAPPAAHARSFDDFVPEGPSAERLLFVRAHLFARKMIMGSDAAQRITVAEEEALDRRRLVYHFDNFVQRHLALPTSVMR
jgi:hypothetical protein